MAVALAVVILAVLGVLFGLGLAMASQVFAIETDPRIPQVDAALPQVNCGACGYPGCISCMVCAKVTTSGAITMEKGDSLPTVRYDVQGETFAKAIEKCPMHCYLKRRVPEEALKELQTAEA
jgi:Na+-translocating ferredoxin:NAD+ oxidoreductase RNF subunit RnfB